MDFSKMTLEELLSVETDNLSEAQQIAWYTRYKQLTSQEQQEALPSVEDWQTITKPDGSTWKQNPRTGALVAWGAAAKEPLTPEAAPQQPSYSPVGAGDIPLGVADQAGKVKDITDKEQAALQIPYLEREIESLVQQMYQLGRGGDADTENARYVLQRDIERKRTLLSQLQVSAQSAPSGGAAGAGGGAGGMSLGDYQARKDADLANFMAQKKAEFDTKVQLYEWELANGVRTSAETGQLLAKDIEQFKADIQRQRDEATFQRELPFKQAAEQRAQAGERRAGQQMQLQKDTQTISALRGQAEQGQQFVGQLTQAGIAPSLGSMRVAMDPWQSIWGIINRMQQSGEITPEMVPVPSAPQAPTAPGVQAPIAPGATAPRAPIPGGF